MASLIVGSLKWLARRERLACTPSAVCPAPWFAPRS